MTTSFSSLRLLSLKARHFLPPPWLKPFAVLSLKASENDLFFFNHLHRRFLSRSDGWHGFKETMPARVGEQVINITNRKLCISLYHYFD